MSQKNIQTASQDEDHPIFTPGWARRIVGNPDIDDDAALAQARREHQAIDRSAAVAIGCAAAAVQLATEAGKFAELPEEIKRTFGFPVIEQNDSLSAWARRHGSKTHFEEAVQIIQDLVKQAGAKTAVEVIDALQAFAVSCTKTAVDYFMLIEHSPKTAEPAACAGKTLDIPSNADNMNRR